MTLQRRILDAGPVNYKAVTYRSDFLLRRLLVAMLAERLEEAIEKTRLDHFEIGRVVGTSPRTVARWLRDEAAPRRDARERILELLAVVDRLSKTMRPEAAHDWLFTPNPSLEHRKPADLLAEGNYRDVLGAVDALGEGVFV
jgi:putative toxin-antitoxin system antitoxin component (TIGR02293 family)